MVRDVATARRDPPEPGRHRRRGRRWALGAVVVLGLALVALRIALPFIVEDYVNDTLSEIPDYRGHLDDVDMNLWRGAYEIEGLEIVKTSGKVPVPFFSSPRIDLSIEWSQLWNGALVGEIHLSHPKLNFVAAPTEEESQTAVDESWVDKVKALFPVKINRFEVGDGEMHFRNFHTDPKVDVRIDDVFIVARNLANTTEVSRSLVADVAIRGRPFHTARLEGHLDIDPFAEQHTFNLDLQLTEVDLTRLNDFVRAYGNFDVNEGRMSVYAELAAADGAFRGYVKPMFEELDVVDWKEHEEGVLRWLWEGIVGAVAEAFENQPTGRFATRVPFSGSFENPRAGLLPTVANVFRNAFIDALPPKLERSVKLREGGDEEAVDEEEREASEEAEEALREEENDSGT